MSAKPKLLMVGHSYHAKTGSSRFLLPLLEQRFEVIQLLDTSWQPDGQPLTAAAINAHGADRVLFFQQLPHRQQLRRVHCPNLTWAPMHDGIDYQSGHWAKLAPSGLKVLNFSQAGQRFFSGLGFPCLPVRYYPKADELPQATFEDEALEVFFWMRRTRLDWPLLRGLLGAQRPRRIVLRHAPDPGESPMLPTPSEIAEYRIELHQDWLSSEAYAALLSSCNVFVAPRISEGIGMATLEAMARGMAVIAVDAPTMNEYLVAGETGYLFDPAAPTALNLGDAATVGAHARQTVLAGHQTWIQSIPDLLDFIDQPASRPASWQWRARRWLGL